MALEGRKRYVEISGGDQGSPYIGIDYEANRISFTLQKGPIKENGVNGCQIDDAIRELRNTLFGLNNMYECEENNYALYGLDSALAWMEQHTKNREARGVEGKNEL